MKKVTKKLLLLCVLLSTSFVLGACKKDEDPTDQPITLVYWGLWEPEGVMEEVIAEYQQLHPNVTIEYTNRPFAAGYYKDQLIERLEDPDAQKAPDILRISNAWLPQLVHELAPIPSDVMTEAEYTQTFYNTAIKDFKGEGGIYAIPLEIDTLGLFYNKDLFEEEGLTIPPADWDSFTEYAKKLTKTDATGKITRAGAAVGSAENILHSADILSLLLLQSGIQMVNTDHSEAIFDIDAGGEAASVVTYYTDFVKKHKVWGEELPYDIEMFTSGKLGMMLAPSWRTFDILDANPRFEIGTAKAPQISLGNEVNLSMYWGEAVSKDSTNSKAAWEFIKFLSEKEQQKKLYDTQSEIREFGEPYSRKDLKDDIKDSPYVGPFIQMASTSESWYMGNETVAKEAFNTMITDILHGNSASKTIEDAALKVTLELEKLQ